MSDLPRVSDILAILYPNSLDYVRQEDLERGTRLHEQMEIRVNDKIYGVYHDQTVSGDIEPVWDWLEHEGVECESTEELVSHQYGFCGHPDLLAAWKGQGYWMDYKFSEQITEQNRMQGTAYCYLTGRKGLFLQCPKAGPVKAIKCKPDPKLWSAFLSGLNVYKFHHRKDAA